MTQNTTEPRSDQPPTNERPGWQTTEFYLAAAAQLLGILFASGVFADGSIAMRIAGVAATVLTALGYTVVRGAVKRAELVAGTVGPLSRAFAGALPPLPFPSPAWPAEQPPLLRPAPPLKPA